MNITELIVERLKKGNNVEIPNIGTLSIQLEEAHMDPMSGVFYPNRKTVVLTDNFDGDTSILNEICEKECVSENVAQMMWKNYIDALIDKLNRTGSHEFPSIGMLSNANGRFAFAPLENINLGEDNAHTQPLQNVNLYTKPDDEDPFAVFDRPVITPEPEPVAEPEPEPIAPTPEPEPEPEPVVPTPVAKPELPVEPEPAPAPVVEPKAAEPEPVSEPQPATLDKPTTEEKNSAIDPFEALKDIPAPTPENDEPHKKKHTLLWILIILLLVIAGGLYYFFFHKDKDTNIESALTDESIIEQEGEFDESDSTMFDESDSTDESSSAESDDIEEAPADQADDLLAEEVTEENEDVAEEVSAEEQESDDKLPANENAFTNCTDLIAFDQNDIFTVREELCRLMSGYIEQFLTGYGYQSSKQPMMDRVRRYADSRLEELLNANCYSAKRFFSYNDYVHDHRQGVLKQIKGQRARVQVQTELMTSGTLKQLMDVMVEELGLRSGIVAKPATAKPAKQEAEPAPTAKIRQESQRGFDIVAGFYTERSSAIKLTNALKQQGCDAYIIDKQGLYYVSMGSASTQTAAEAMLRHIKTWYDGDAAIRKL